jgi:hypothetical protein
MLGNSIFQVTELQETFFWGEYNEGDIERVLINQRRFV